MPATTGTYQWYAEGLRQVLNGSIPVETPGALKALLCGLAYTPDKEAHTNKTHLSAEAYGGDWPQGGLALSALTVTNDAPNDRNIADLTDLLANDCTLNMAAKHLVIYYATPGADSAKTLIGYITFASTLQPTGGAISIALPNGLFTAAY